MYLASHCFAMLRASWNVECRFWTACARLLRHSPRPATLHVTSKVQVVCCGISLPQGTEAGPGRIEKIISGLDHDELRPYCRIHQDQVWETCQAATPALTMLWRSGANVAS